MKRVLPLLAVLALLAACGSDGAGGSQLTARDFALVKVAGDGQSDTVTLSAGASADRMVGRVAADLAPSPDMFPDPLIVKVVPKGGVSLYRGSLGPTSPNFESAPVNLPTVTWKVIEDGCGEAFTAAEQPGADSTTATFWVKGTKARLCHMRAQTVERDSAGNLVPVVQAEFEATQLPGPAGRLAIDGGMGGGPYGGGSLPYAMPDGLVQDEHGNATAYTLDVDAPLTVGGSDLRTLQVADSTAWAALGEPPRRFIGVRVIAGGRVVATGELSNQGWPTFFIQWKTVTLPFHNYP